MNGWAATQIIINLIPQRILCKNASDEGQILSSSNPKDKQSNKQSKNNEGLQTV